MVDHAGFRADKGDEMDGFGELGNNNNDGWMDDWLVMGRGKRTLVIAPSRVGLGAVFFVPNSRFILAGWV